MQYAKDDRVRHRIKDDWGLGQVVKISGSEMTVFFVGAGKKRFLLKDANLEKVKGEGSQNPILDNLKSSALESSDHFKSLRQSIERFLEIFPQGFYGDDFHAHERGYKDDAHDLAKELLGRTDYESLLSNENYAEICKRAMRVANKTNLIFPNEKMALNDGLASPKGQRAFSEALFVYLYGDDSPEMGFEALANVLEEIGAAKWPIISYFPFVVHPEQHIFIKPTITKYAADACFFEISYKPELNWKTYDLVLKLANHLFEEISELRPRDMIDVQSFMWSIAPGVYKTSE